MLARFPGTCVVCGGDIIPRQHDVEIHPTIRGPKGGKKVCHAECLREPSQAQVRKMEDTLAALGRIRPNPMVSVRRNSMVSVRRNSDCGCAYGADCGCGGYRTNPKSDRHRELMAMVKAPYSTQAEAEAADVADLRRRFAAERRGGRGRKRDL